MHCAGDLGRAYLNEIRSAGDPTTGEAGVITAREVDVSFPIGMHRCGGQVFVQALLADYVLANPKYVIDLERLPLRRKRRVVSEAVLLTLPWHHNFYHWMVEILPRLSLCDSLPELQGLPLLVARSSPRFVRESLALTGYLHRALFLDDGAYREAAPPNPAGTGKRGCTVERAVRRGVGLGLKAHPRMLRHACGNALANKGHDDRAIQAYLGQRLGARPYTGLWSKSP